MINHYGKAPQKIPFTEYLHPLLHAVDLQSADPLRKGMHPQVVERRGSPLTLLQQRGWAFITQRTSYLTKSGIDFSKILLLPILDRSFESVCAGSSFHTFSHPAQTGRWDHCSWKIVRTHSHIKSPRSDLLHILVGFTPDRISSSHNRWKQHCGKIFFWTLPSHELLFFSDSKVLAGSSLWLTSSSSILNSNSSFWSLESCSSCCSRLLSDSDLSIYRNTQQKNQLRKLSMNLHSNCRRSWK